MNKFQKYLEERIKKEANYTVENNSTVRQTASAFGVTKSTIYRDLTYKLKYIDYGLYKQAKSVLELNKLERATRGGKGKGNKNIIRKISNYAVQIYFKENCTAKKAIGEARRKYILENGKIV